MKTYVLVVVRSRDDKQAIAHRIFRIPEVSEVNEIFGFVDFVVEIETESFTQVSGVVARIKEVKGIWQTFTLVAVYLQKKRRDKP